MFHILQGRARTELLYQEVPPFAVAMLIASVFFKFGSFPLEVIAFLAVWYGLAAVYAKALELFGIGKN